MNAQLQPIEPTRADWLEARRHGIGGSDAGAIVGVSPWATPLDVYESKVKPPEDHDNPAMEWGRRIEPIVRQAYSDKTGRVVQTPSMIAHPVYAWMLANVDGIADGSRVLEIKTARSARGWGEEGSDQIPLPYLFQVQHYMAVTALPVADVAVLIGGSDFRLYEVPADHGLQAALIDAEAALWQRVVDRNPPDPVTFAEVRKRFGSLTAVGSIEADRTVYGKALTLQGLSEEIAELEQRADACRAEIMRAMGDKADTLTHAGQVIATWKLAKAPQRFDATRFKADHADLYQQYIHAGEPSRRLLLKPIEA